MITTESYIFYSLCKMPVPTLLFCQSIDQLLWLW